MHWNQQEHSYEELRDVVINVMLDYASNGVDRFDKLLEHTALSLYKRDSSSRGKQYFAHGSATQLHPNDAELVLEIVWDLFRQGILTLGVNASNPGWPWLRLTRFGEAALQQGPDRFHNKAGFMKALRSEAVDISPDAVVYLQRGGRGLLHGLPAVDLRAARSCGGSGIPQIAECRQEQPDLWDLFFPNWRRVEYSGKNLPVPGGDQAGPRPFAESGDGRIG